MTLNKSGNAVAAVCALGVAALGLPAALGLVIPGKPAEYGPVRFAGKEVAGTRCAVEEPIEFDASWDCGDTVVATRYLAAQPSLPFDPTTALKRTARMYFGGGAQPEGQTLASEAGSVFIAAEHALIAINVGDDYAVISGRGAGDLAKALWSTATRAPLPTGGATNLEAL